MPRLPPLGDISNEISNETQMKAKWATLKNPIQITSLNFRISESQIPHPNLSFNFLLTSSCILYTTSCIYLISLHLFSLRAVVLSLLFACFVLDSEANFRLIPLFHFQLQFLAAFPLSFSLAFLSFSLLANWHCSKVLVAIKSVQTLQGTNAPYQAYP